MWILHILVILMVRIQYRSLIFSGGLCFVGSPECPPGPGELCTMHVRFRPDVDIPRTSSNLGEKNAGEPGYGSGVARQTWNAYPIKGRTVSMTLVLAGRCLRPYQTCPARIGYKQSFPRLQ